MRILILCTGNSCRSQMAEGLLASFDKRLHVYSAGTKPAQRVHPLALQVMREAGIDLSAHAPKPVSQFLDQPFDVVITVCDHAKETCPLFTGNVPHRLHVGFEDPAVATGSPGEVVAVFRRIRDEIRREFHRLYTEMILPQLDGRTP
jgi:arsenate reductase (thioredoxin)